MSYSVRPLQPEDVPSAIALMERALGPSETLSSRAFFEWKHFDNPFGRSAALVADAAGEVVGLRVFLRWRFASPGGAVASVRAVDTATDPTWSRRGIFSRLTRDLLEVVGREGTVLVFNTPNLHSRPGYLKLGWQDVGRARLRVRPIRWWHLLRPPSACDDGEGLELPTAAEVLDRVDFLGLVTSEMGCPRAYRTELSEGYLRWRYAQIPVVPYLGLWERKGGSEAALIVRERSRGGRREVALCEILTNGAAGENLLLRLVRRLASMARDAKVDYLVSSAALTPRQSSVLTRAGFLPGLAIGPRMTTREISGRADRLDPTVWASWQLGVGDLELF